MAGGNMLLYMSLASRLAPLLLMTSAVLVATRWLHDTLAPRDPRLGAVASVAVVIGGMAVVLPFAARMGLLVGIRSAVAHHEWSVAGDRVDQYARWGGKLEGNLLYARGLARAHERQIAAALPDFQAAAESGDPLVSPVAARFEAALCFYALHRDADAERALRALPDEFREAATRDYLLGRIAERRGDLPAAEGWFARSLKADPNFAPALYRSMRLASLRHDIAAAERIVAAFRSANPQVAKAPFLTGILEAVRRGEVLVDYDPYSVDA